MDRVRIKFWGVRGSLAAPGRDTVRFGGNTACMEIEYGRTRIICDAGTGIRPLGLDLVHRAGGRPIDATILLSHVHWDHYLGLPFFRPFFEKKNRFVIAGPSVMGRSFGKLLRDVIRPPYMPITLADLGARISYRTVGKRAFKIGAVRVLPMPANHPDGALGWRFDFPNGRSVVVMTDNEPLDAARDVALIEYIAGADALIHDAQYSPAEYGKKRGWGHSPFPYPVGLACAARMRRVYLTHFDPESSDAELMKARSAARRMIARRGSPVRCELAREGLSFFL